MRSNRRMRKRGSMNRECRITNSEYRMGPFAVRSSTFTIRNFIAALMLMILCIPSVAWAARGTQEAPRLLNLWFTWQLPEEALPELAKWDMIVLDADQQARFPERIRKLRALNPKIKILAYVDSTNIASARFVEESHFPVYELAHAIPEAWYMHRGLSTGSGQGGRVGFWPGAYTLNITNDCPRDDQGRRWQEFLPEFIEKRIWSSGLWDGIFLDNALDNVTSFVGGGLDMQNDGQPDADAAVDASWRAGWSAMARNLRARLGRNALIMGNGSQVYADVTNGILFENFPRYGWANGEKSYQFSLRVSQRPPISAFNTNPDNREGSRNWRLMRFGLMSSLLGDGYYSYDFGDRDHGQSWWFDEYDTVLGRATQPPRALVPKGSGTIVDGVWWREYERGAVIVNSTHRAQTVDLPGVYERIRGVQDTATNNGRLESVIDIPPQDGFLLLSRNESVILSRTSAIVNGSYVRVYDAMGVQTRSGFFVRDGIANGGDVFIREDVDQDGVREVLVVHQNTVQMTSGRGGTQTIYPFGKAYRGPLSVAVGNTDRSPELEIVAGRANPPEVRVLSANGTLRTTWRPYAPQFRGEISVAIGDVDGDGKREIVTSPGPGGGPHIRIFRTDGTVWGGGFFAFDSRDRAGTTVATGDVDGDGADEIIVGSGKGAIPRVRVMNARGIVRQEITLDTKPSAIGVTVSLADVDGDGRLEILATGARL
jgi:hypothetical protein